jgi:hypothetical protein
MRYTPGVWFKEFVPPDRQRRIEDWAEIESDVLEVWELSVSDCDEFGFGRAIDLGIRLKSDLPEILITDRLRAWSVILSAGLGAKVCLRIISKLDDNFDLIKAILRGRTLYCRVAPSSLEL